MPALALLAAAGLVLVGLLFVADATLEKSDSPVIATSQRSGLPEHLHRSDKINILTTAPAPEPDMTLQAVRDAQPEPERQDSMKIPPSASAAHAEALPEDTHVSQPMNDRSPMNFQYRRSQVFDRFSIKGQ